MSKRFIFWQWLTLGIYLGLLRCRLHFWIANCLFLRPEILNQLAGHFDVPFIPGRIEAAMRTRNLLFVIRTHGQFKEGPDDEENKKALHAHEGIECASRYHRRQENLQIIFFGESWRNGNSALCPAKGTEKNLVLVFEFINSGF